jgi:hypothetical protein
VKVHCEKTVQLTLVLNEREALALAQLCVQVGGEPCWRRDFYHEIWRAVGDVVGDVPTAQGLFSFSKNAILCTGTEKP